MAWRLLPPAAFVVLLLAAPGGHAQSLPGQLSIDVPATLPAVRVDLDHAALNLTVHYTCSLEDVAGSAPPAQRTMVLTVKPPLGIQVFGSFSIRMPTCPTTQAQILVVPLEVKATSDAQGEVPIPIQVLAHVDATSTAPALEANATTNIAVLYRGVLQTDRIDSIVETTPGEVAMFRVGVRALANAPTRVSFEPGPVGDWNMTLPASFILQPGASTTVLVNVTVPTGKGWVNREETLQFGVRGTSARAPQQGQLYAMTILARDRGYGEKAPPSSAAAVALVLLGAAFLARRRRMD